MERVGIFLQLLVDYTANSQLTRLTDTSSCSCPNARLRANTNNTQYSKPTALLPKLPRSSYKTNTALGEKAAVQTGKHTQKQDLS